MAEKKINILSFSPDKLYFCTRCRKKISTLEEVLLVEGNLPRGFCSEVCIHDFFTTLVDYFEEFEADRRVELKIEDEDCLKFREDEAFFNKTIEKPTEIFLSRNEFGEEIYTFLNSMNAPSGDVIYFIVVCLVYERTPSFIILNTCTTSDVLLKDFQIGERVSNLDYYTKGEVSLNPGLTGDSGASNKGKDSQSIEDEYEGDLDEKKLTEISLDTQLQEELELKKSSYLAKLMGDMGESDIGIENFPMYERFVEPTLMEADEIYEREDDEGDVIITYIKSFAENNSSFFYLVLCLKKPHEKNGEELILPIISFPSVDAQLYKKYKEGEQISGIIKN